MLSNSRLPDCWPPPRTRCTSSANHDRRAVAHGVDLFTPAFNEQRTITFIPTYGVQ